MYDKRKIDMEAEREGTAIKTMHRVQRDNEDLMIDLYHKDRKNVRRHSRMKVGSSKFDHTPQGIDAIWSEKIRQLKQERKRNFLRDFPD